MFNERHRIRESLEHIRQYAHAHNHQWEVVVVDDGSTDGTSHLVRGLDLSPLTVKILCNNENRGKGYSVKRGMLAAGAPVLMMCDADMSMPISEADKLLSQVGLDCEVVIASRDMPDSQLSPPQPMARRFMSRVFREMRRCILLRNIRDTQCGFKCFTRSAARRLFAIQQSEGYAFDCELLGLAVALGYRVREVGVLWCDNRDSRVRPVRDAVKMFISLLAIGWRVRRVSALQSRKASRRLRIAPMPLTPTPLMSQV